MDKLKSFVCYFACAIVMTGIGYWVTSMILRHAGLNWLELAIGCVIAIECVFLYVNIREPAPYNHIAYGLSFAGFATHIACVSLLLFGAYADIIPHENPSVMVLRLTVIWIIRFVMQMYILANKPED